MCSGIEVGQRFGRLVATARVPGKRIDQWRWACRCDCGKVLEIAGGKLKHGSNRSCGCLRRDQMGAMYRTHGRSKTPEYAMFYDARKRALARGLAFTIKPTDIVIPTHCPVLGFELKARADRDLSPSLDRVIPSAGYTPDNIRVISFRANRIKSDASPAELRRVLAYSEGR